MSATMPKSKISSNQVHKPNTQFSSPSFKVFVGGLPHNVTKDEIFIYFCAFGKVVSIDLPQKAKTD